MTGFINVNKAEGGSSAFVVNKIKRLTGVPCGHMGTLDPLACGVLPVGVGNATRLFNYFLDKKKVYRARFRFGVTTATLDREGECQGGGSIPTTAQIEGVLSRFVGDIDQVPPLYSAKSVNGRRGYQLARAGEQVTLPPKRVHIERFALIGQTAPDEWAFEIECGGGTYIRSLARDLATACDTVGYMSFLQRTQSGVFTLPSAVALEELTKENISDYLIPTDSVLSYPVLGEVDARIFNGVACPCEREDGLYKLYREGEFYGIATVCGGLVKATTKLC